MDGDASHEMDLVEVYRGVGMTGELEAMGIRALLASAGIESVLVGTSTLPMLPFVVKVAGDTEESARKAMAEAVPLPVAAGSEIE